MDKDYFYRTDKKRKVRIFVWDRESIELKFYNQISIEYIRIMIFDYFYFNFSYILISKLYFKKYIKISTKYMYNFHTTVLLFSCTFVYILMLMCWYFNTPYYNHKIHQKEIFLTNWCFYLLLIFCLLYCLCLPINISFCHFSSSINKFLFFFYYFW